MLASQGVPNHAIAQQTGLSRPTVIATRVAFTAGGMAALGQPQKRNRLRLVLTPELEQKILDTTLKTRPLDGTGFDRLGSEETKCRSVLTAFDNLVVGGGPYEQNQREENQPQGDRVRVL